ncbi:E3 ubiquitin-protein ligase hrd1 [Physocladia obscura]|uniref:RING-type E3 ubiquitin transferase n=1 Tax=Physocladia obscura TaxID=109957 RepID=A0AAD5XH97_9FUNG|nr:E3 ubiquitin-protein ligase hrd1 [Physocladia obscura]
MHFYGFPLHILRDLYMVMRSFVQRCRDLVQYHRATRNMNQRYPDATEAELAATDRVCIICREEMIVANANAQQPQPVAGAAAGATRHVVAKKLACGHIFHMNCLRSWLERQQSCPTCRRSVLEPPPAPAAVAAAAAAAAPVPVVVQQQHDALIQAMQALLQQQQQRYQATHSHPQIHQHHPQAPSRDQHTNNANVAQIGVSSGSADRISAPEHSSATREVAIDTIDRLSTSAASHTFATPQTGVSNIGSSNNVVYPFTLTPLSSLSPSQLTPKLPPLEKLSDTDLKLLEGQTRENAISRLGEINEIQKHLAAISVRLAQVIEIMPRQAADTFSGSEIGGFQAEDDVKKGKEKL